MSILPLTTRSRPVTARIWASTASRRASRSRNQDIAIRPITATPKNAAIGIPRRFIPWAIVNDISWSGQTEIGLACQVAVASDGMGGGAHANPRNLRGFLDAFKAVAVFPAHPLVLARRH